MTTNADAFLATAPTPARPVTAVKPAKAPTPATSAKPAAKPAPVAEPVAVATDPVAVTARAKLHDLEHELNHTLAEREREIRGLITAIVAREHILLLGPAGTGKSALARLLCNAIKGGNFFEWLLTRFSTPEEVFGPVSLDGLKHDTFRRVTRGKLPEATVGFLDETFKANSAILNSLLTVLNEREFDNDGGRQSIPLETLVGASNELPEGAELGALFDRFLLRFWTTYTRTPESFTRLMTGDEPAITTTIDLTEITAAQAAASAVTIPDATVEELFKLRAELIGKGVSVSDRRWRKAGKILKATAWLEGATEVTPDVFPVLAHVLWDLPEQQLTIQQLVARYASAELAAAQELYDAISQLLNELPAPETPEFPSRVSATTREMKRASEKLTGLSQAAKPSIKVKIDNIATELDRKYQEVRKKAQQALGL